MITDTIVVLEERVGKLLQVLQGLREENAQLKNDLSTRDQKIQELDLERQNLTGTIGSLQGDSEDRQRKLHTATEKLESIIARLDSVG